MAEVSHVFYPGDAPVPSELRTEAFVLRPLRATDVDLDYDAVMATQETLRQGNSGEWPRPDFTRAENLVDLQRHEADFAARRGFTYTVMDLTQTRCLGCVYAYPPRERTEEATFATMTPWCGFGSAPMELAQISIVRCWRRYSPGCGMTSPAPVCSFVFWRMTLAKGQLCLRWDCASWTGAQVGTGRPSSSRERCDAGRRESRSSSWSSHQQRPHTNLRRHQPDQAPGQRFLEGLPEKRLFLGREQHHHPAGMIDGPIAGAAARGDDAVAVLDVLEA